MDHFQGCRPQGRTGTPKMVMSDSLDLGDLYSPVFVQIGEPVMAEDVRRERAKRAKSA